MRVAPQITLNDKERKILQRWSRGRNTPARLVLRAKIVLRATKGERNKAIASVQANQWFLVITDQRILRGMFNNVKQLQQAITDYIDEHNEARQAFKWTAKADTILEKVRRARAVLDKMRTE